MTSRTDKLAKTNAPSTSQNTRYKTTAKRPKSSKKKAKDSHSSKDKEAITSKASTSSPPHTNMEVPQLDYDALRFRSKYHWQAYDDHFLNRPILDECLFALEAKDYGDMKTGADDINATITQVREEIVQRKWSRLSKNGFLAYQEIVLEFYANMRLLEHEDLFTSYVRGKVISFAPKVINSLLGIPLSNRPCSLLRRANATIDKANRTYLDALLCEGKGVWGESKRPDHPPRHLVRTSLCTKAKVWWSFVQTILLPIQHKHELTRKRLWCVASLMEENSFVDVGLTIANEILDLHNARQGSLAYAGIICRLCKEAGVAFENVSLVIPRTVVSIEWVYGGNRKRIPQHPPQDKPSSSKGKEARTSSSKKPSKNPPSNAKVMRNLRRVNENLRRIQEQTRVAVGLVPYLHVVATRLEIDLPSLLPNAELFNEELVKDLNVFEELSESDEDGAQPGEGEE